MLIVFLRMLESIREMTWQDVFGVWKQYEGHDPGWLRVATQNKGWPDWESWRMFTAQQLLLPKRPWNLFRMTDPMTDISHMRIGPYSGWQSRCSSCNTQTFVDFIQNPVQVEFFRVHDKVASMMKAFPKNTQFIGLRLEESDQVVCVEGHHRAVAVALAAKDGQSIDFGEGVQIALATLKHSETHLLDEVLARGTHK